MICKAQPLLPKAEFLAPAGAMHSYGAACMPMTKASTKLGGPYWAGFDQMWRDLDMKPEGPMKRLNCGVVNSRCP